MDSHRSFSFMFQISGSILKIGMYQGRNLSIFLIFLPVQSFLSCTTTGCIQWRDAIRTPFLLELSLQGQQNIEMVHSKNHMISYPIAFQDSFTLVELSIVLRWLRLSTTQWLYYTSGPVSRSFKGLRNFLISIFTVLGLQKFRVRA